MYIPDSNLSQMGGDDTGEEEVTACVEDGAGKTKAESTECSGQMALAHVPKDRGWAWFCVLGGFFMNFLVVGAAAKSFGILFVEFKDKFEGTNAATSWIVALSQCLALLLGPLASTLSSRFSSRWVVFSGGLVCCAGFIFSSYAFSLEYLYFSYGILVGIGSALAYAPCIVTVGQYFEKRRALANGITVAGSGVGNFAVPPLMRILLDYYGLQGAMLILAGLMLNVCVCGALLRPLDFYNKYSKLLGKSANPAPVTDAGNSLLIKENDQRIMTSRSIVCEKGGSETDTGTKSLVEEANGDCDHETCLGNNIGEELDLNSTPDVVLGSHQSIPSVTNNSQAKIRKNSCDSFSKCCCLRKTPSSNALQKFDWTLLKNMVFLIYALSVFFAFSGYPQLFMIIPSHAEQMNFSKTDAAFLVSIIGIADLIGRIGFGWFADLNLLKKKHIYIGSMAIAGISCFFVPIMDSFVGMAAFCALIGLFAGAFVALIAVILAESLGIHQLHSAFGLVVMFMGASFLFAPATAGWLKDWTGHWKVSFGFCGVTMLLGALIPLMEPLAIIYEKRKKLRS